MSLNFQSLSLQSAQFSPPNLTHRHPFTHTSKPRYTFTCISMTRPARKTGYKTELMSDSAELVRTLLRNINDKRPLTTTLDKYVKVVRTEHCFLLFEQLGKSQKWLQCLEVCLFYHTLLLCIQVCMYVCIVLVSIFMHFQVLGIF